MKKIVLGISVIFTLMFLLLFSTKEVLAETADSGTCGDNLTWTLDDDGTLTISGSGEMKSFAFSFNKNIKKAIIENGATNV
ncbi:MAG: hypothetical protein IJH60_08410, partial [Eubacterium sp.]|nr:hypothetical protein [Eubacterium sp.]